MKKITNMPDLLLEITEVLLKLQELMEKVGSQIFWFALYDILMKKGFDFKKHSYIKASPDTIEYLNNILNLFQEVLVFQKDFLKKAADPEEFIKEFKEDTALLEAYFNSIKNILPKN